LARRDDVVVLTEVEEAQRAAHRALVVGAVVVVDQDQHALGGKVLLKAGQLLDVAHVVGVEKRLGPVGVGGHAAPLPALVLELQRPLEVGLALDVDLQPLAMERDQEARGLAQDRDDLRSWG
jgi:hypothetical protein